VDVEGENGGFAAVERATSDLGFCKSDDIISSVIDIIRRLRIAMPARSDD